MYVYLYLNHYYTYIRHRIFGILRYFRAFLCKQWVKYYRIIAKIVNMGFLSHTGKVEQFLCMYYQQIFYSTLTITNFIEQPYDLKTIPSARLTSLKFPAYNKTGNLFNKTQYDTRIKAARKRA